MIDNAHRAALDAIYQNRADLDKISTYAEELAERLHPAAPSVPELHALAGDAWAHYENSYDILAAGVYDGQLPADEVRAWLDTAAQIIERARVTLP